MSEKKENRVFKLWKCSACGESFNYWLSEKELLAGKFICPLCYGEINIPKNVIDK